MRANSIKTALILALFVLLGGCLVSESKTVATQGNQQNTADWQAYSGTNDSQRFSPLAQINRHNIGDLELAWQHRSGDFADGTGEWGFTSMQVTPIVANNSLYYCTPFNRVFALDPLTGKEKWVFDPQVKNKKSGFYPAVCRGVSYWESPDNIESLCSKRIIYGTRDAELIALDANTGEKCPAFGTNGIVQLKEGVGAEQFTYYPTSPPYIINNLAIIGALVPDNESINVPSGVVRAFDIQTGELRWAWEPIPEALKIAQNSNKQNTYKQGTPNVWAPIAGDKQRNLVFVPTGNPSPDLFGGNRNGSDKYGSSVVALDATNGKVKWYFQTVHHDLWDYDVASQPATFTIDGVGGGKDGLLQATKTGMLFLLDRETGEPMYPVEERPVPQTDIPGEYTSPTQPFPTHPKPIHPTKLTEDNLGWPLGFGASACKKQLASLRNEGIYTPPSLEGSVLYPSPLGGVNWGGVSINPQSATVFVPQTHLPFVAQLVPRDVYEKNNYQWNYPDEYYPMEGTPYGVHRYPLISNLETPCNTPPWGSFTAVDLKSGDIKWQVPLGSTRDLAPFPFWLNVGTPVMGGALSTAGNVVFIGASSDYYFRAYDADTGKVLWKYRLPTTATSSPMSYQLERNGSQYIVIAVGGYGWSKPYDALMAFKLKK